MKLVLYELKKLAGVRYLWVLLALTLTIFCGLFYYTNGVRYTANTAGRDIAAAIDDLFREYNESPEHIEAALLKYLEYEQLRTEEIMSGGDPDTIEYENVLGYKNRDGEAIEDRILFGALLSQINEQKGYFDRLDSVINVAEGAMERFERSGATDTPIYRYERNFYDTYSKLRSEIDYSAITYVHGWNRLLTNTSIGVFIFIYIMLAAGVVFLQERSGGMLPILLISRNGRIKTAAAKCGAVMIMSVIVVLIFTAAMFIVCGVMFGYSNGNMPVQSHGSFWDCPYNISFIEFLLALTAVRCVTAAAFAGVVTAVSALTFSAVITYVTGAIIIVGSLTVNYYFFTGSGWIKINMAGMMEMYSTLGTYGNVLIGRSFYSSLFVGLLLYFVTAAVGCIIASVFGCRRGIVSVPVRRKRRTPLAKIKDAVASAADAFSERFVSRRLPSSLFGWECSKLMTPSVKALVALLLVMSAVSSYRTYSVRSSEYERSYESYLNEHFFGELSENTERTISELRTAAIRASDRERYSEMMTALLDGKITKEEYEAFADSIEAADAELELLDEVNTKARYLSRIETETGVRGWIIYETDLCRILDRDINIFLLAAVIVVFARGYTLDYAGKVSEGNIAVILRTTRRGRRDSFRAKICSTMFISLMLCTAFMFTDIVIGVLNTERFFDMLSAPMMSMEGYRILDSGITVGGYIAMMLALRFVSHVMLALLTVAASYMAKKLSPTLFLTLLVTLLPYALVYMGILALRYVDFTAMLAGGKLLTRSAAFAVFGGTYMFAVLLVCGYAVLTVISIMFVRYKTGK